MNPAIQEYLKGIIDFFPFMVWMKDRKGRILMANREYAKMVGLTNSNDLTGKTDYDFFSIEMADQYVLGDQKAMESLEPVDVICPIQDSQGNFLWIESHKKPLFYKDTLIGTIGYARNITEKLQREQEYESIIQHFPHSIVRYDRQNKRIFLNAKTAESYGVPRDFLLGKTPSDYPGGASALDYEDKIQSVFRSGVNAVVRLDWITTEGKQKVYETFLVPESDSNGQIIAVISMGKDVTEFAEDQIRIHNLAYFDPLTKLPNRSLLTDRISQAKADSQRRGSSFVLMVLDLDRFKEINDTYGHNVGDSLLNATARRLETCIRDKDTIARLGGDEFAILLSDIREGGSAAQVAMKILKAFEDPILIKNDELFITPSIGIAVFPTDSKNVEDLLKFADSALYLAKNEGRNNFQFYSTELGARSLERMSIEKSLRKALQKNEFILHYQTQVDLHTMQVIGVEALIRWKPAEGPMIPPNRFISIAENSGLIIEIGKWALTTACLASVQWNQGRAISIPVSVNLSTRQFIQNDLEESIKSILSQTGCKPAWLKLEITESLLLENNDKIQKMLLAFHDLGLEISMDDFGTGYSSLSYLNQFPISQLKIDHSFVKNITTDVDRGLLVKAIISMAKSLRKTLVAEGVETPEQAAFLAENGCQFAQGYLFSYPVPFDLVQF